ncbi:MAG: cytochrome c3 family protein, partial [Gammaproteobacteria bacterium]
VAIAVEESRQQAGGLRDTGPRSLSETGLHRRRWSWALLVVTLAITLAWPAWQVWQRQTPRANATTPETAAREGALLPFTADRLWDPGPLARAHQFFAGQCEHCHQTPFIRVTDNACLSCHRGLAQHSDHVGLLRSSGLATRRCTDCHFEHRGNMGLVADSPVLCTACHGSDRPFLRQAGLRPVNGFSTDHPEFRAAVKSLDDMGRVKVSRISLDDSPSQPTGLVFRHDKHLVADGVKGPDGRKVVMTCADCHHPEGRGADMRPITYRQDCASCHRLDFEPGDPRRVLPHGQVQAVLDYLGDYYARRALQGGFPDPDAPAAVRLPRPAGRTLSPEQRGVALAWASARARKVADEVFNKRLCKTCHSVSEPAAGSWKIKPVVLAGRHFPTARFDHRAHAQLQCSECHAAARSASAADILMPGIHECRQCHGDPQSKARVISTCVDCHRFHQARELTMDNSQARDETGAKMSR